MTDDNTPVIIGAGQITEKPVALEMARSPLTLMTDAVLAAAVDAGLGKPDLQTADRLMVTTLFNDDGLANPPGCLADRLGLEAAEGVVSGFGGTSPQAMLHDAMERIAAGRAGMVILAGAEAQQTRQAASKAGLSLKWSVDTSRPQPVSFAELGAMDGATETEHIHSLSVPAVSYPLFENALRGHYRRSLADHQQRIGELMSRLTRVAAANPLAWFPEERSPEEIITPGPANRRTAFPYTKRMNAMLLVNQSAALIVTSRQRARQLGVPSSRWVYCQGQAQARDHWYLLNRENYFTSPAIRTIGQKALAAAGTGLGEIDFFDLYSCFPSSIQITRDMLGISVDDNRDLTVTGGLPYFGGPGNNYVMHSLARMCDLLREKPGTRGLVTGNSFYMSKHAVGIYGTEPGPSANWTNVDAACQREVDAGPSPSVDPEPSGPARVETWTVVFDREDQPERGVVIGRTESGRRFAAYTPPDRELLAAMTREDFLGAAGTVTANDKLHIFTPE